MELKHILGNVPVIRIIDFFVGYTEMDYTKSDIKEHTGIKQADMLRDFPNLLGNGVIIETRRIRGEPLYRLNRANPITKAIITFNDALVGDVLVSPEELRATMLGMQELDTWVPKHDPHALSDLDAEPPDANEPEPMPVEPESVGPTGAI